MLQKKYRAGSYVLKPGNRVLDGLRRYGEYLDGVTLARQDVNRLKPEFIASLDGDVLEIGGYDPYFKERYSKGRFINLDLNAGPHVDVVGDARDLHMFASDSLGGVLCISVLEHCPSPRDIIAEIRRVLRPGGKAFVSSPWLFESHMEPNDFLRFSRHVSDAWFSELNVLDVHFTNSYFGMVAHVLQNSRLLRLTLGTPFFLADLVMPGSPKWTTQISYTLQKPQ